MEIAITKISSNGQLVIPLEVREDAHIRPKEKFLVFNENGYITLKPLRKQKEDLKEELEDLRDIKQSEKDIKEGKFIELDSDLSPEEVDKILMNTKI